MTVKYNDPYGNRKHAQLKGDKTDSYFKIIFDEATLHETDEGYILYGNITEYQNIVKSYRATDPIDSGICAVPFYNREYKIRKKDDSGQYQDYVTQPSLFEKALCKYISENEDDIIQHNAGVRGEIAHLPDAMIQDLDDMALLSLVLKNISFEVTDLTGLLPEFTPKSSYQKGKSSWKNFGATMEEKVAFLIKQMEADVKDKTYKQGQCLADLTERLIKEHSDNENFIQIYFDMLIACVR